MNIFEINKPTLIKGSIATDIRGNVVFNNDLDLTGIVRHYKVQNNQINFPRGFHGHKKERKIFTCINGSFLITYYTFIEKEDGSFDLNPLKIEKNKVILSDRGDALLLPNGYWNANMNLTKNAILSVYSTLSNNETKLDDFRIKITDGPIDWQKDFVIEYT